MTAHSFQPGDILLLYGGDSLFDRLTKWALGSPFIHCMMVFTDVQVGEVRASLIVESVGRGVRIRSLEVYKGKRVRAMRYRGPEDAGQQAAWAAFDIAGRPQSFYDFRAITKWVLPRLICQKIGLPVPLSWHRNRYFICSELVAEAYSNTGYPIVPDDIVPLPGDFAESPKLESLDDITL